MMLALGKTGSYAFNRIGKAATFGFLAVVALTQAVFTWYFVPETKNTPLEEIEAFWAGPASEARLVTRKPQCKRRVNAAAAIMRKTSRR